MVQLLRKHRDANIPKLASLCFFIRELAGDVDILKKNTWILLTQVKSEGSQKKNS